MDDMFKFSEWKNYRMRFVFFAVRKAIILVGILDGKIKI